MLGLTGCWEAGVSLTECSWGLCWEFSPVGHCPVLLAGQFWSDEQDSQFSKTPFHINLHPLKSCSHQSSLPSAWLGCPTLILVGIQHSVENILNNNLISLISLIGKNNSAQHPGGFCVTPLFSNFLTFPDYFANFFNKHVPLKQLILNLFFTLQSFSWVQLPKQVINFWNSL